MCRSARRGAGPVAWSLHRHRAWRSLHLHREYICQQAESEIVVLLFLHTAHRQHGRHSESSVSSRAPARTPPWPHSVIGAIVSVGWAYGGGGDEGDSRPCSGRPGGAALRGRGAAVAHGGAGAGDGRSRRRELHRRVPAERPVQNGDAVHPGTGGRRRGQRRRRRGDGPESGRSRGVREHSRRVRRVRSRPRGPGRRAARRRDHAAGRGHDGAVRAIERADRVVRPAGPDAEGLALFDAPDHRPLHRHPCGARDAGGGGAVVAQERHAESANRARVLPRRGRGGPSRARGTQDDRQTAADSLSTERKPMAPRQPGPAFLFDLDGTLVDSVYQHLLAWREALEQGGIELAVWRIHRRIGMSGGLFLDALGRETGRRLSPEDQARLQQAHAAAFKRQVSQVRPLPGAVELLAYLSRAGVPWAIATSGRLESARPLLEMLGVAPNVPVVTRDQVEHAKPDPHLFLAAAERPGADVAASIVVGDSVWDLLAARRAGALGVGLLSGGYGQDELERAGAYRVYQDPADLLRHLDEVGVRLSP